MGDRMVLAGRYRLDHLIGAGSFSEVWRSLDVATGDVVAVKTVRRFLYGDHSAIEDADVLVHEAEILRRLEHPNIVRVRDTGNDEGRPFVVMDYLDGPSLRSLLSENGPMDETFALYVGRQIADALAATHARGITHNDVKPENIILVNGEPHLVDFGVARDLRATLAPSQASELAGTLAYIAPEVLEGQQPGPSADLYALAVTLYESVAGRTPFAGTTALRAAAGLSREPLPLQQVAPETSLQFGRFLDRALAAIPSRRFPTATAFRDALPGVSQPTVRFTRPASTNPAAVPAGRKASMLPKVVAGMGVGALLFAGAMLLTTDSLFSGTTGQDDPADAVAADPTATPSPQSTPTATEPPVPTPTEAPPEDEDPARVEDDGTGNPVIEFFSEIGSGIASARDGLGDMLDEVGAVADDIRGRFRD